MMAYLLSGAFPERKSGGVVTCVMNQRGLIEGLRTDDPERIQRVFDIRVAE